MIAGPTFVRRRAGRKVRTPWSSRFLPPMKVVGMRRLRPKGNAPGNARGLALRAVRASEAKFRLRTVPQKINRRCNAPRWPAEGKPSEGLKAIRASGLRKVIAQVRVKRWGKSPPRSEQSGRHGKPRVVQGQIGGESWPSSSEPSGRLLESRCEPGPRGMIATARRRKRLCAEQNPAYRLARHNCFSVR